VSYDFALFVVDGDPTEEYLRFSEAGSVDDPNPGPVLSKCEVAKRKLADSLRIKQPLLDEFVFGHDSLAKSHRIDQAEAQRRYRHIELNLENVGLQITLFDDWATVTRPYGHSGDEARNALSVAWDCLKTICGEVGYRVYDPQLGRILDLEADFDPLVDLYFGTTSAVNKAFRRPWWKFWKQ
jgi:hypothetical protein